MSLKRVAKEIWAIGQLLTAGDEWVDKIFGKHLA